MARPWVRAATTGVLVVAAGVVAHQSGGSHPVTPVHLVVLTLLAVATVRLLQGAPGSWLRTFLVLLVGQWAVHLGLALSRVSGSGHADHAAPGPVTAAVHSHEGVRRAGSALGPTLLSAWGEGVTSLILNPAMMTAHVVAAVALAVWLTAGERAAVGGPGARHRHEHAAAAAVRTRADGRFRSSRCGRWIVGLPRRCGWLGVADGAVRRSMPGPLIVPV